MKFILSFSIIVAGLGAGFGFSRMIASGAIRLGPGRADSLRSVLQKLVLLVFGPLTLCGAVWSLDLGDPRAFAMPFIGLFALALGLLLGFAGARLLGLSTGQAGVYATCSSFTNLGNIGGLVIFLLSGEAAFAFVPFYKLFEEAWYYSVLFPIARRAGERIHPNAAARGASPGSDFLRVLRDPFFLAAISGISLGLGLNIAGLRRPPEIGSLNSVLIPSSSFIFLFTVGMRMRFRIAREHRRAAALIVISRSILVPAVVVGICLLFGLEGGLTLKVILVLSAMPVGFLGLVPPTMYGLDIDFANSLWLASNASLVFTVPFLAYALPYVR